MADDALRFVTLVGSLRAGSYHTAIARALPALAPAGVTIEALGSVAAFPPYDHDLQVEGFPAPVTQMAAQIAEADGVVIVTPEYNYSVPGMLKNALDWLSRLSPQPFAGKPVAIQSASPGMIGGARGQHHLRQILVFLDAFVLNKPEVMVGGAGGRIDSESGAITDTDTRDVIAAQLAALAAFARRR